VFECKFIMLMELRYLWSILGLECTAAIVITVQTGGLFGFVYTRGSIGWRWDAHMLQMQDTTKMHQKFHHSAFPQIFGYT